MPGPAGLVAAMTDRSAGSVLWCVQPRPEQAGRDEDRSKRLECTAHRTVRTCQTAWGLVSPPPMPEPPPGRRR